MLNKINFNYVEERIYKYFRNIKTVEKLKYKCAVLEDESNKLLYDIKNTNVSIDPYVNMAIDPTSEKVQCSSKEHSYIERETIKQITKMEREWKNIKKNILKIHYKMREINKQDADIAYIIDLLKAEYKKIIEMKYKDKQSYEFIGQALHVDKSTISRNIEKIIKNMIELLKL